AVHLRGNVPTRLRKLGAGDSDALLLAAAGIDRLRAEAAAGRCAPLPLEGLEICPLDPDVFVPAPSQGALALEARREDAATLAALEKLDDVRLRAALRAERELLARLEGGCQLALGAWCRATEDGELELVSALGTADGLVRSRV